jgi:tetratricopeptide (TPR) repeat protein
MRVQWVRLFSIASVSAGFVLLSFCSSSKAQQTLNRNEARKQCNSYDANERLIDCTVVINAKGFGSRFEVATAYDGRCWAFNDLQQYERGLADCKAAVSLAPQYYYGHLNLANSLIGLGQISNGIAEFTKAITLKPSVPHAHWGRGRAFASLGNKDFARKDFEYVLSIQPTNEEAREAIAPWILHLPCRRFDLRQRHLILLQSRKRIQPQVQEQDFMSQCQGTS